MSVRSGGGDAGKALGELAKRKAAAENISYGAALREVRREHPELVRQYIEQGYQPAAASARSAQSSDGEAAAVSVRCAERAALRQVDAALQAMTEKRAAAENIPYGAAFKAIAREHPELMLRRFKLGD
jgi:hypothetical protein